MPDFEQQGGNHIPLTTLWETRAKQRELSADQIDHLQKCDDCSSMLGVCHGCGSMDEVERQIKKWKP
jgi:hypothetical protein